MNTDSRLKFPLIELSEWIFEKEKVFFEIREKEIDEVHYLKESQIENQFNWNTINKKYMDYLISCYNERRK